MVGEHVAGLPANDVRLVVDPQSGIKTEYLDAEREPAPIHGLVVRPFRSTDVGVPPCPELHLRNTFPDLFGWCEYGDLMPENYRGVSIDLHKLFFYPGESVMVCFACFTRENC